MTQARPVLPTDLLALVSLRGRGWRNEAWTRERIGAAEEVRPLETALDQCLAFLRRRNAWISVRRQRLRGLVGARRRGGRQAWEIDCLIDATSGLDALPGLLEGALADAARARVEKLFVRLTSDSELLDVVRSAGFLPYRNEVLYVGGMPPAGDESSFRPVSQADAYPLFRLYGNATPESIRRYEAATYAEWLAAQERHWLKNGFELVSEQEGRIGAWLRASKLPQGLAIDLLAEPAHLDTAPAMITAAGQALGVAAGQALVLMPESDEALARGLEQEGFVPVQHYISLLQRTARPITLPKLTPAVAKNVVGA
jgi:hypothetical protein